MTTKDLGVWKAEDCALVLIDYQNEMFEVIRSETNADMVELHARLLAKTAKDVCTHGPQFKQKNDLYFLLRLQQEA